VCAADDCAAPQEKTIKIHSSIDPESLAREALSGYLPSVAGVGHSWICVFNNTKIVEIKTIEIQPLVREVIFDEKNRIHFEDKSATY
jgi:hypothetical protein